MTNHSTSSFGFFCILRALRVSLLRKTTSLVLLSCLLLQSATAQAPDWWGRQQVLKQGATADDYAVANIGQLKNIASKAAQEMESSLVSAGGAGSVIRAKVAAWAAAPLPGVIRDDYASLTIGQLKAVAKPFYDQLAAAGLRSIGTYPWTGAGADDYALANLGQLKAVFAFNLPAPDPNDTNHNGISDGWEIQMFGNLNHSADEDFDGDGLSNIDEWRAGTAANNPDTDGDGVWDGLQVTGLRVFTPLDPL